MRFTGRFLLRVFAVAWASVLLAPGASAASLRWRAPVSSLKVTRSFIKPPTPYAAGHRGVDLAGWAGEPVLAVADGEVSFAGALAGRGVVVVVHGNLRTTYEPVHPVVKRGVRVRAGDQIATLERGHSGCPVTACLHWGLRRGSVYLDPMAVLKPATIRLLPLDASGPSPPQPAALAGEGPVSLAPSTGFGPSPAAWSLAALAGGGVVVAFRRR